MHEQATGTLGGAGALEGVPTTPLRRSAVLWRVAVAIGIVLAAVQLGSGRWLFTLDIAGGPTALRVGVAVASSAGVGLIALGYWTLQLWAVNRLRARHRRARVALGVLGGITVAVDVSTVLLTWLVAEPTGLGTGDVVALVLCVAQIVVVGAAMAGMYQRSATAFLTPDPAPEVITAESGAAAGATAAPPAWSDPAAPPAPRADRKPIIALVLAAGVVVWLLQTGAALTGAERVGLESFISHNAAASAGMAPGPVSCGWSAGLAGLTGNATGAPCTGTLGDQPITYTLISQGPLQITFNTGETISLGKLAGIVRESYAQHGIRVNANCGPDGSKPLVVAPPGTQISCTTTDTTGAHSRVIATVTSTDGQIALAAR